MNRSSFWLAAVGIVSLTLLLAYYLWLSNNRFYIVSGPEGVAYQVDRRTGKTWVVFGKKKVPHDIKMEPLPSLDLVKGFAQVDFDLCRLSGEIYNGTKDWFLARIEGRVHKTSSKPIKEGTKPIKEGMVLDPLEVWESSFAVSFADNIAITDWGVEPLGKERFFADLFGCPKGYTGEFEWYIDSAYGYPADKVLFHMNP